MTEISTEAPVPKPAKRTRSKFLWLGQPDAQTGFSGWLVLFTGGLVLLTAVNVWILYKTDSTLYEQATTKDRGWILVDLEFAGAKFQEPNDPISLRLVHRHVGSAAVAQLSYYWDIKRISRPDVSVKWENVIRTSKFHQDGRKCKDHSLPTMLPANLPNEVSATNVSRKDLPDDKLLKQGDVWWGSSNDDGIKNDKLKHSFVIYGCSEYWSIKAGRTEFCRYLDTGNDLSTDPSRWQFKECPVGNKLD